MSKKIKITHMSGGKTELDTAEMWNDGNILRNLYTSDQFRHNRPVAAVLERAHAIICALQHGKVKVTNG